MTRREAYKWLADMLHIEEAECHIGKFSPDMCEKVIKICRRQGNTEIQEYRSKHYGYEQNRPVFTRGYKSRKKR